MKIRFSREFKIGLLVIATIGILYFGINFLSGINIFNPTNYYYARFDSIEGLVPSNPVTIRGYKVGQIKSVVYNYNDPTDDVVVIIQVDDELKIPFGSRAVLKSDLLGGPHIDLDLYPSMKEGVYKKGDTIPSRREPGLMAQIGSSIIPKIDSIIPQLDTLVFSLRATINSESLDKSMKNIEQITTNFKSFSASLDKTMKNDIPGIVDKVDKITTDFAQLGENVKDLDLNSSMKKLDHTLTNLQFLSDKLNSTEGNLGLLLNDTQLYDNLKITTENANELLLDLKSNPKRYVHFSLFGKSDKK
jgi:phospholipid/cholesterol/gamma-HCH transport system substrate-binding protein